MAAGDIVTVTENSFGRKGNMFDGTDDYVLHDAHAVARVAANDTTGTYSAWVYLDNVTADMTILGVGDNNSANEFLDFTIRSTGNIRIKLTHGGATQFEVQETTPSLVAKKWIQVGIVQDGTQPKLYINGKVVVTTNSTATDLTMWFDELTLCDKFAIGVKESNATHTLDFKGAIGITQYRNKACTADEMLTISQTDALDDDDTYLQLNVSMENDGTTDSGLGADNGTLVGHAYYGGVISDHSYALNANVTGHAAEDMNTINVGQGKLMTVIKRGD